MTILPFSLAKAALATRSRAPQLAATSRQVISRGVIPSASRRSFASSSTCKATHAEVDDPQAAQAVASYNEALDALAKGDYEKASEECQKAISVHGTENVSPDLLFALGVIQQQGGKIPEAIATWERVLELQSDRADVHTNLAASYMVHPTGKNPQRAKEHILKAQQLAPLDKEVVFNSAVIQEAVGDLEAAEHAYRQAKDLGVSQADVHLRNVSIESHRPWLSHQYNTADWRQALATEIRSTRSGGKRQQEIEKQTFVPIHSSSRYRFSERAKIAPLLTHVCSECTTATLLW